MTDSNATDATAVDLARFMEAQQGIYAGALSELRAGAKQGHWMWFIFPQVAGLGYSSRARFYAITGVEEARAYLADAVLGARLRECTSAVLAVTDRSAREIFGAVDELKFRSSMTLFARLAGPDSPFAQALEKYFEGQPDQRTLEILSRI